MNLIDFTKNGGFRFKQFTLRRMQEAYFHILKVFIEFCNIPDAGNYIISGCNVVGPNITAGYMYIDGELCRFEQTVGTLESLIKKDVATEDLSFKNGVNEPVFRYTTAIIDPAGIALNTFNRVFPVFDDNYVHTDNNYSDADELKLSGIEDSAQVNVQADWETTVDTADSFIRNKPSIQKVLYSNYAVGAFISNATRTIEFPDVGTSDYYVECCIESLSALGARSQDIMAWATADHTPTSFDFQAIALETSGVRNIRVKYTLIQN